MVQDRMLTSDVTVMFVFDRITSNKNKHFFFERKSALKRKVVQNTFTYLTLGWMCFLLILLQNVTHKNVDYLCFVFPS